MSRTQCRLCRLSGLGFPATRGMSGALPLPFHAPGLGRWASQQRHAWKTGRLPAGRQQRLAALGFLPDALQDAWLARFRQLAAFHSAHGHCRVPRSGPAARQYPGLHAWLHRQLLLWRRGTLADDRRRQLEGLGVEWGGYEASWDARFQELLQFRQVHAWGRAQGRQTGAPGPELAPGRGKRGWHLRLVASRAGWWMVKPPASPARAPLGVLPPLLPDVLWSFPMPRSAARSPTLHSLLAAPSYCRSLAMQWSQPRGRATQAWRGGCRSSGAGGVAARAHR